MVNSIVEGSLTHRRRAREARLTMNGGQISATLSALNVSCKVIGNDV